MSARFPLAALALLAAAPAAAQSHAHPDPAPPAGQAHAGHAGHQDTPSPEPHQQQHGTHAGHGMAPGAPAGTDLPPGNAPAPVARPGRAADRYYDPAAMAAAEAALLGAHGGMVFHQLIASIAEHRTGPGADGYRWEGEFWIGGDRNRLVLKSEGEGDWGSAVEQAEVQALYSRALDPYWNLQAGIRQDIGPRPVRSYAVLGIEGLAPYWIEADAALFRSDRGDLLGRIEGSYDQRITQRLILQPRGEIEWAAQDMPRQGIGHGLSHAELGLRLRYEIAREFAPYVGVSWERRLGRSADLARGAGEDTGGTGLVFGIRAWF